MYRCTEDVDLIRSTRVLTINRSTAGAKRVRGSAQSNVPPFSDLITIYPDLYQI